MKKGLTHIDWAMSIGLFVLYLIILIILFKSTLTTEDYSSDFLTSIVKQGLMKDSYVTIEKIPIFIKTINNPIISGNYNVSVGHVNANLWTNGYSAVIDNSSNFVGYAFSDSTLTFDAADLKPNKNYIFWIVKSDSIQYTPIDVRFANQLDPLLFEYNFGVAEKISGIHNDTFINNISLKTYEGLKSNWSYPENKEFFVNITYVGLNSPLYWNSTIESQSLPSKEKVNVVSWTDFLIENDTKTDVIRILIKTW